jgi:hypothetical protein
MKKGMISRLVIPHGLIMPRGLLLRAGLLLGFFLVCHGVGWRASTMVLSGTRPAGVGGDQAAIQGILYILAHLGVTVIAPVFVLGAAVLAWLNRCVTSVDKGTV